MDLMCADPESFVRGVPNLITFFFFFFVVVDGDIEDPNTAINGPLSAHQRNAIDAINILARIRGAFGKSFVSVTDLQTLSCLISF